MTLASERRSARYMEDQRIANEDMDEDMMEKAVGPSVPEPPKSGNTYTTEEIAKAMAEVTYYLAWASERQEEALKQAELATRVLDKASAVRSEAAKITDAWMTLLRDVL